MTQLLPEIKISESNISEQVAAIRARSHDLTQVEATVRSVIDDVRDRGDDALLEYSQKFEGVSISKEELRVNKDEIRKAAKRIDRRLLTAMRFALSRIEKTQGSILKRLGNSYSGKAFAVRAVPRPLTSVGCYIPGGKAVYASSVLMTAGVARVAGVKRVVLTTPPDSRGEVSDAILAAAWLCGVNEVYRIGGAQAIAALAYGTETLEKVEKILGPGGIYVAAAKRLVSLDVPIDFFAGPTELVVVGDESADPRKVAWDLVGQAEHGEDTICGLVTKSSSLATKVRAEVSSIVPTVERREFVEGCLGRGFIALCETTKDAIGFINALAPEHLELMVGSPSKFASGIQNAGLLLLGEYSPCAASDYCVGTDHVIPTGGFAATRGGLSALDFVKMVWSVEGSRRGLEATLPSLRALAFAEGLPNHYLSVESRFKR